MCGTHSAYTAQKFTNFESSFFIWIRASNSISVDSIFSFLLPLANNQLRAAFAVETNDLLAKCYWEFTLFVMCIMYMHARWTIQQQFCQVNGYGCAGGWVYVCYTLPRFSLHFCICWFFVAVLEVFSSIFVVTVVAVVVVIVAGMLCSSGNTFSKCAPSFSPHQYYVCCFHCS